MAKLLDKETKQFLMVLLGIVLFMVFVYPRMDQSFGNINFLGDVNSVLSPGISSGANQDIINSKNYIGTVNTTKGTFVIDFFEKSAPLNVANVVKQASKYKDAELLVDRNFLFKVDATQDSSATTADEINADFLGLVSAKVKDVQYLKNLYDENDASSKPFSPANLEKNADLNLKQFYSQEFGYTYNQNLLTPAARKYLVYMASTGPNTNRTDFFVLMTDAAPQVDGRYTPIGQVTSGFDVLDNINTSTGGEKVNSLTIETK